GKRLLAALHEEVTTRFIPRFYYEGPFTPVAGKDSEDAEYHAEAVAVRDCAGEGRGVGGGSAPGPAPTLRQQHSISAKTAPPSQRS
ncbi:unnamed protein product, partial [Pylaiella littoralis]